MRCNICISIHIGCSEKAQKFKASNPQSLKIDEELEALKEIVAHSDFIVKISLLKNTGSNFWAKKVQKRRALVVYYS